MLGDWRVIFNLAMCAVLVLVIVAALLFGESFLRISLRWRLACIVAFVAWGASWALVEHL